MDDKKREKLFQDAAEIAIKKDFAIIPLYNQVATWAARKGVRYTPRPTKRRWPSSFSRSNMTCACSGDRDEA